MANVYYDAMLKARGTLGSMNEGAPKWYAKHFYEAGYRKQEWISVKDKLPEKDVRVLVYLKTDRSYTKIDTDRLDDRGFVRWFNDVTHWMPLPEPPETKGETE